MTGRVAAASRWVERTLPARCIRRYLAISGTTLALVIAGHAFTAFIPLLIVVASLARSGSNTLGDLVVDRLHLSGSAADAVQMLFARPPGADGTLTVLGVIFLAGSGLSMSRALQRAYEAAWGLPRGLRGTVNGVVALTVLLTEIVLLSLIASLLRGVPAGSALTFASRAGLGILLWLLLQHLLLGGRIRWRLLLPGAITAAVGQQLVSLFSAVWMPGLIERNAERYGVIGVTFALLSWLIVLSVVLVAAAVLSAELGRPSTGPAHRPDRPRGALVPDEPDRRDGER
ncbi:MAG: YihY/virulence factor BrkB family protein [Sporichthyaceae bacterium]|nr:YihY/virulence factor BrkB family protein [Sporichthyaceae bacterium]